MRSRGGHRTLPENSHLTSHDARADGTGSKLGLRARLDIRYQPEVAPLFVSQKLADHWLSLDVIALDGDEMLLPAAPSVRLRTTPAVYFSRIDDGGDDPYDIVGSVKTDRELAAMGADHLDESVLVGDCAYTVVPGFLAQALHASGVTLDGASWHELLYALEHVEGAA